MTTKQVREDLKEIRYYYSMKDDMDMAMEYVDNSKIRDILNRYNAVMKMARMRIYTIYVNLYIKNLTQKQVAATMNLSPKYVQSLNNEVVDFLVKNL